MTGPEALDVDLAVARLVEQVRRGVEVQLHAREYRLRRREADREWRRVFALALLAAGAVLLMWATGMGR